MNLKRTGCRGGAASKRDQRVVRPALLGTRSSDSASSWRRRSAITRWLTRPPRRDPRRVVDAVPPSRGGRSRAQSGTILGTRRQTSLPPADPVAAADAPAARTLRIRPELRPWRLGATLFTISCLALLVAGIGCLASSHALRRAEIGLRLALRASGRGVLRLVLHWTKCTRVARQGWRPRSADPAPLSSVATRPRDGRCVGDALRRRRDCQRPPVARDADAPNEALRRWATRIIEIQTAPCGAVWLCPPEAASCRSGRDAGVVIQQTSPTITQFDSADVVGRRFWYLVGMLWALSRAGCRRAFRLCRLGDEVMELATVVERQSPPDQKRRPRGLRLV
jgi:hypothetical protein